MMAKKAPYILVLTHDIDSLSLKELPLSGRTFWGFVYRSVILNFWRFLRHDIETREYLQSLLYVLLIPLIKLGLARDPWQEGLHRTLEIEKRHGVRSTLFFIPFAKTPGYTPEGKRAPNKRAAYYELKACADLLQHLERNGWEVGVHGIDAYRDLESAKAELEVIRRLLPGKDRIGIRMHWLYHLGERTWRILEAAGYAYDATFGWNERIGFPSGQYRPFIPEGMNKLVVLPLNIQDGALLGEWHQFLSKQQAWEQVEQVLTKAKEVGAVVTVLWHNNSFVAPRYWGWLYELILKRAREDGAYICRACDAVEMLLRGEL
ncbi:MAG: hypothetical protein QMD16_13670 [Desulfitobacteriaceae bacterium]|nr:hypothetical protein [Desulfitobacteriaceae bacterium]